MSVDRNFYLGPYAECVARVEHRTEGRAGCVNRACTAHHVPAVHAFCPTCGKPIKAFSVEVKARAPDVMDITGEALHDFAAPPGQVFFCMPNVRREGKPEDVDFDTLTAVDLRARHMGAEEVWFARAFAPELAKLREAFASVEIKWGLLQWYS